MITTTTTTDAQAGRMAHKLYSSREAADEIGCDKSTVTRTATRLQIGQKIGNALAFTKAEIAILKREIKPGPGNPNFGKPADE